MAMLTIPLMTLGVWGDDNAPLSLIDMKKKGEEVSVMVIPQAALVSKVTKSRLSYRGQLQKDESERLYNHFVATLKHTAIEFLTEKEVSAEDHAKACQSP